mmetsp:Transcript_15293/g.31082  ORF Transcript_15293/g.31082 Transcript_15293/m.31082 type:complete len:135 (-) Transcript_15293:377-781(-)
MFSRRFHRYPFLDVHQLETIVETTISLITDRVRPGNMQAILLRILSPWDDLSLKISPRKVEVIIGMRPAIDISAIRFAAHLLRSSHPLQESSHELTPPRARELKGYHIIRLIVGHSLGIHPFPKFCHHHSTRPL